VAARKPAQSFDPDDPHPTDAEVLAAATGEDPALVCPSHRWLRVALAPPMAADRLGLPPVLLADLVAEVEQSWADGASGPATRVGWVETVGGPRSPIAHDGDGVDLARALGAQHLVLVADASLGTLNAVRSSLAVLEPLGVPVTVALNRFDEADPLQVENLRWLRDLDGLDVVTSPEALATRVQEG
jgi:dethiobiotin synthetase